MTSARPREQLAEFGETRNKTAVGEEKLAVFNPHEPIQPAGFAGGGHD